MERRSRDPSKTGGSFRGVRLGPYLFWYVHDLLPLCVFLRVVGRGVFDGVQFLLLECEPHGIVFTKLVLLGVFSAFGVWGRINVRKLDLHRGRGVFESTFRTGQGGMM